MVTLKYLLSVDTLHLLLSLIMSYLYLGAMHTVFLRSFVFYLIKNPSSTFHVKTMSVLETFLILHECNLIGSFNIMCFNREFLQFSVEQLQKRPNLMREYIS